MIFTETRLKGAFVLKPEKSEDARGFFARTFCKNELEAHGLNGTIVQSNLSYNRKKGTFRGMHFQTLPYEEEKIVSCVRGAFMDYIIDLRESSSTYRQWVAIELSEENNYSVYVPKSFAHGFFTLVHHTTVHYQMTEFYQPAYARGVRFNDPAFNIEFPFAISTMSEKDRRYADLLVSVHDDVT